VILEAAGARLAVIGCSDHPPTYAAGEDEPGIAYGLGWVREAIARVEADWVLVTPHWGPNMVAEPIPAVRESAAGLVTAGATLVAGHSAHVFHGVSAPVLYDLGDFVDDYATDPRLRNDLGLLFLIDLHDRGPTQVEAVPLAIDCCHTRLADADEATWIRDRFTAACASLGTEVREHRDRLVIDL
jgi:hypothetical protein